MFQVEHTQACQRKFDAQGKEVEPNFGKVGVVRTGYLHSSYSECVHHDVTAQWQAAVPFPSLSGMQAIGTPDVLDYQQVKERLQSPLMTLVTPAHAHTICFWAEEETYEHVDLEFGQAVRLKTRGDCPLIGEHLFLLLLPLALQDAPPPSLPDSFTRLDTEQREYSANYTGGAAAGQSWTDRVMGVKQGQDTPTPLPGQDEEGVAEEEWVGA